MIQLLLIAVRNLVQHRRRTLLLGGAIGGVTALLVILIELSTGLRSTILSSATTLMTGHVNVAGFYKVTAGQSAPVVTDGPFPETKEFLAGYWIVDVSEERAIEIASQVVAYTEYPMEVRQIMHGDEAPQL